MSVQSSLFNQPVIVVASKDTNTSTNPISQYFEKNADNVKFRIPSQMMSNTYYFNLRPLLQTPNTDEEADEDMESGQDENEMEIDNVEEEFEELSPKKSTKSEHPKRTKKSTKSKKRRPVHKDAEYDFDDPFIDDTEAANAYVSIFDLMAGRVEESEFDTMEIPEDSETEGEDKEIGAGEVPRKQVLPDEERAKDFFVYQGPLVEQTEKEFEMPRKRRKPVSPNKPKSSTKSALSKEKTAKKDSPRRQEREKSAKGKGIVKGGVDDTFTKEQHAVVEVIKSKKQSKGLNQEKLPKKTTQNRIELPSNIPSEVDFSPSQATPGASPDKQKRARYDTEKVYTHRLTVFS